MHLYPLKMCLYCFLNTGFIESVTIFFLSVCLFPTHSNILICQTEQFLCVFFFVVVVLKSEQTECRGPESHQRSQIM